MITELEKSTGAFEGPCLHHKYGMLYDPLFSGEYRAKKVCTRCLKFIGWANGERPQSGQSANRVPNLFKDELRTLLAGKLYKPYTRKYKNAQGEQVEDVWSDRKFFGDLVDRDYISSKQEAKLKRCIDNYKNPKPWMKHVLEQTEEKKTIASMPAGEYIPPAPDDLGEIPF